MKTGILYVMLFISSVVFAQIPTNNLVAQYQFTNGTFIDAANGNNFTQTGTALTAVDDRFLNPNNAVNLAGDHLTRIDIDYPNDIFNLGNTATISFWVKTTINDSDVKTIFEDTNGRSNQADDTWAGYYIYLKDGKVGFSLRVRYSSNGSYRGGGVLANKLINDGDWHHVALTISNTLTTSSSGATDTARNIGEIYVDGVSMGSGGDIRNGSAGNQYLSESHDTNVNITIGNNRTNDLPNINRYQDAIDDINIYTRILSNAEVLQVAEDNNFCLPPNSNIVSTSSITVNSANVDVSVAGTFDIAYHKASEPFSNATIITNVSAASSTTINNLDSFTDYKLYIREQCTINSSWSIPVDFTTLRIIGKVFVDVNATGENNGSSWVNAFTSLYDALSVITSNEEVWVAQGTYTPDNSDRSNSFLISRSGTKLYGGFIGTETDVFQRDFRNNETILSGDFMGNDDSVLSFSNTTRAENAYNIVVIENATNNISIDGFTISNGHANGTNSEEKSGAAIYKRSSALGLTVSNCIIKNNVASDIAGGIYNNINRQSFQNNTGFVTVENSVFTKNLARWGSSIYGQTGSSGTNAVFSISNSLFNRNIAKDNGSSLGVAGSAGWFRDLAGNSSISVTLTNNTYVNNEDLGTGASVNNLNRATVGIGKATGATIAVSTLANNIFWGNRGVGGVTSVMVHEIIDDPSTMTVSNSIDENNFSGLPVGVTATNSSSNDPLFTDFVNNDFTVQTGSPAIDSGDNSSIVGALDLLGNQRVFNTTVDMGAYEFGSSAPVYRTLTINSANGIVTTNPNPTNGTYDDGISVTLTATPDAGYQFDGWSGDASGITNPLTIIMDADKTVTAIFSQIHRTLTINTTGSGSVTPASGTTYNDGATATLTATPVAGWQFDGWSGDASGITNPLTIIMDADKTVTATFSAIQRSLTINATNGAVSTNPNPTKGTYDEGTSIILTATPDAGYQFDGWSGDATGVMNPLTIIMDADKTVTATFSAIQRALTINATNGAVSTNPNPTNGAYDEGTSIILTAAPDAGYQFDGWSGDATGVMNPLTITMDADKTITALFSTIQRTLILNTTNGSVSTNPNPTNGTYDEGTSIILTATPDAGYQFDGWSGDATGVMNPLTITMDADKTVTATFSQIQYMLVVNTTGNGNVTLSPAGGTYTNGEVVTITATADQNWQFDGWSGDASGNTNPLQITINGNTNITATFSDLTLGINDQEFPVAFMVYPNPVSNNLHIKTDEVITSIRLYSILGNEIKVLETNSTQIDVSSLSKGVYFLIIETNKGKGAQRFIKR
ncbi:InlB B-repeat-containing protein [uncultured Aquimarina sp.]|uniref:beta strand repeat-containing protein n=1 Tax=uncultured Aquimarina sp. TaxID=575652 RepID=UPI0026138744|nr:InlB B-repeat-containing protein [uncultured Aquimarina sp.]